MFDTTLTKTTAGTHKKMAEIGALLTDAREVATPFRYSQEDIQGTELFGLGCKNLIATAFLKEGETVLDLGSGAGAGVFLAATKVGLTGEVIGLDEATAATMVSRENAKKRGVKPPHVAFVQASLASPLPITSNSINCVLSNGVINLLPETSKENLLKEVYRVLKPGGRIIASKEASNNSARHADNIAEPIQLEAYRIIFKNAGFTDTRFLETENSLKKDYSTNGEYHSTNCIPTEPKVWIQKVSQVIIATKSSALVDSEEAPQHGLLRWWDAYPKQQSLAPSISVEDLANLIRSNAPNFAVIDVRRADHGGGHVRGSDNCYAQTFYDDLPTFMEKYRETGQVIFYCSSSRGRAPRCAGWYQDYLNESGITTSKAYVLQGGIKAWLSKYSHDMVLVDRD